MTNTEWNAALDFLCEAEEGDYVTFGNRTVIRVYMCGGDYIMYKNNEFYELTDDVTIALMFLANLY